MSSKYFFIICIVCICGVFSRPDFHKEPSMNFEFGLNKKNVLSVVHNNKTKKLEVHKELVHPYVATAAFNNLVNSTGWSYLKVTTNGSYPDLLQAEAAGIAEGFITADFIRMDFQNRYQHYCDNEKEFCDSLDTFLQDNLKWISAQIKNNPSSNYWFHVSLIYKQIEGLLTGYLASGVAPKMTLVQFWYLQISGDLEDLEVALGKQTVNKVVGSGSCSALIKLFPKNADIVISQITWNDFVNMLRVYKLYDFQFHDQNTGKVISGATQSFSSYPGLIYSGDDFYILSSEMVSMETTIGNSNKDLIKFITSTTLLEYVRTIISNRLSSSGNEWCSLFEKFNSGTYNNQWMVLDYKLFKSGKTLQPDTLWILEQLPGTVHMADMTVLLQEQGYWPSYNLPYFPFVYNISGVTEDKIKFGSWFDYQLNPRAQIFKRDQHTVVDMSTLVKLMRYNDFKNDPLSKCNCTPPYSSENTIASRSDLNPANGTYPFGALAHRRHGATDVKATNSAMARSLSQFISAGPTFDQQPPFQWSKTEWKKPLGHPDLFKFGTYLLDWKLKDWIIQPTNDRW